MTQGNNSNGFKYTYSASEQSEIKRIRDKYVKKEETVAEKVRRIDNAVTDKAIVISLILGVLGVLILGFGMSVIMTEELSKFFSDAAIPLGITLGVIGAAIAAFAYPIYCFVLKKGREKAAPEIIRLTDNLVDKQ